VAEIHGPAVVLAGAEDGELTDLGAYRDAGGYVQLERARAMAPAAIVDELNASNLRGRGGAFFPAGRKMQFIPSKEQIPKPHYVCVNADESEPGTFKDREIMQRVPHRLIEGCLIAARAIDSQHVFIYIRGEYLREFEILRGALDQAKDAGLLGATTIVLHRGAGAYICGEESGLLESLEGKRGQPRSRPPFPAVSGLYASPTLINNVETIATIPKVLELGGA
jgi:NADH-quinone oxidoreductase subunit F